MGYRVKNELEISIFVNGVEYPLASVNALNFFHAAESTKYYTPTFHFAILDVTNSMPQLGLGDASQIKVVIQDSGSQEVMNFRVGTWYRHPSGGNSLYEIDGNLDAPRYRIGSSSFGIGNSSSGALSDIASLCGLTYSGVQTNDKQLWMPRNQSFCQFANYIAARGYLTDKAHLVLAVDLQGNLRYRDVRGLGLTAKVTSGYSAPGAFHAVEFRPLMASGITNSLSGYRDTRVSQSIFKTTVQDSLTVVSESKRILVNEDVREAIKRGNFTYSPISFGNVHDNFDAATYQNARFDALRSLGAEFMFSHPTKLHALDSISLTTSATASSEYDGVYVISHKTIYVQGNTYAEKITAYKEGLAQ